MVMHQMRKKSKTGMTFILIFFIAAGLIGFAGIGLYNNVDLGGTSNPAAQAGQTPEEQIKSAKEAVSFIEDGLKKEPDSYDLNLSLGNSYYDLGMIYEQTQKSNDAKANWEKGVLAYEKAIAKNDKDPNVLVDCATLAYWTGQNDKAEKYFKKAMAVDPKHINAKVNYGSFLNSLGKKDEAKKTWEEALALKPDPQTEQQIKNNIASLTSGGGAIGGMPGKPGQLSGGTPAPMGGGTPGQAGNADSGAAAGGSNGGQLPEGHPSLDGNGGSGSGSAGAGLQMGSGRPGR